MPATTVLADQNSGTLKASTSSFDLKSGVDSQGREREYVEGFLATTHIDKGNDRFTKSALKAMAEDINGGDNTIDAAFRSVDESEIGNIDHDNNPASPFGDKRIVPAFRLKTAEVRSTNNGENGLWVKGVLNSDGMPGDTVSAVKNSIKDGFLNAFSVEFVAEKVKQMREGNKVVRVIEEAKATGAALTGRPMNPEAVMTDADLKSMAVEYKVDYRYDIGDKVSWNNTSGSVRDRTKDGCFSEEIDGDQEICGTEDDPAYLIEVDNDEGTMVAHKQSLFTEGKSQAVKSEFSEEERTPPEAARENAQMALDAKEETGNPNECGTEAGWRRAEQLTDGRPLSMDVISRMSQFARHRDNSDQGEEGRSDCGWMMWKAWGGDEGVKWAQNMMDKAENKTTELKQDYTIQTPDYDAISEGSWEKPSKSDFPDDYNAMSIFLARNSESDNFSDQSLPVVDYRNDEATLVLEALRSAHSLAPQVEGLGADEVKRIRNKAEALADKEFNEEISGEKNNIKTMSDEDTGKEAEEASDEVEESGEGESEGEAKSQLTEDVKELKSTMEEVKDANDELREENEELKSELEDLRQLQEVKSDIDEVKSMVDDLELEDGPLARQEEKRFDDKESKADWKKKADKLGADYLLQEGKAKSNVEAFAENQGIDSKEVKRYVEDSS